MRKWVVLLIILSCVGGFSCRIFPARSPSQGKSRDAKRRHSSGSLFPGDNVNAQSIIPDPAIDKAEKLLASVKNIQGDFEKKSVTNYEPAWHDPKLDDPEKPAASVENIPKDFVKSPKNYEPAWHDPKIDDPEKPVASVENIPKDFVKSSDDFEPAWHDPKIDDPEKLLAPVENIPKDFVKSPKNYEPAWHDPKIDDPEKPVASVENIHEDFVKSSDDYEPMWQERTLPKACCPTEIEKDPKKQHLIKSVTPALKKVRRPKLSKKNTVRRQENHVRNPLPSQYYEAPQYEDRIQATGVTCASYPSYPHSDSAEVAQYNQYRANNISAYTTEFNNIVKDVVHQCEKEISKNVPDYLPVVYKPAGHRSLACTHAKKAMNHEMRPSARCKPNQFLGSRLVEGDHNLQSQNPLRRNENLLNPSIGNTSPGSHKYENFNTYSNNPPLKNEFRQISKQEVPRERSFNFKLYPNPNRPPTHQVRPENHLRHDEVQQVSPGGSSSSPYQHQAPECQPRGAYYWKMRFNNINAAKSPAYNKPKDNVNLSGLNRQMAMSVPCRQPEKYSVSREYEPSPRVTPNMNEGAYIMPSDALEFKVGFAHKDMYKGGQYWKPSGIVYDRPNGNLPENINTDELKDFINHAVSQKLNQVWEVYPKKKDNNIFNNNRD